MQKQLLNHIYPRDKAYKTNLLSMSSASTEGFVALERNVTLDPSELHLIILPVVKSSVQYKWLFMESNAIPSGRYEETIDSNFTVWVLG